MGNENTIQELGKIELTACTGRRNITMLEIDTQISFKDRHSYRYCNCYHGNIRLLFYIKE